MSANPASRCQTQSSKPLPDSDLVYHFKPQCQNPGYQMSNPPPIGPHKRSWGTVCPLDRSISGSGVNPPGQTLIVTTVTTYGCLQNSVEHSWIFQQTTFPSRYLTIGESPFSSSPQAASHPCPGDAACFFVARKKRGRQQAKPTSSPSRNDYRTLGYGFGTCRGLRDFLRPPNARSRFGGC